MELGAQLSLKDIETDAHITRRMKEAHELVGWRKREAEAQQAATEQRRRALESKPKIKAALAFLALLDEVGLRR